MRHLLFFTGLICVIFFHLSCGINDEEMDSYGLPILRDVELTTMLEAEVHAFLKEGTEVDLITVLDGTDKVRIKVKYLGSRNYYNFGFPLYEFELTDPLVEELGGTAQGMSGSPVGPEDRVMGALGYSWSFRAAPYRFLVTPIDAMEKARDHHPFGEFLETPGAPTFHTQWTPIKIPLVVSGVNSSRVEAISKRLRSTRFDAIEFVADVGGAPANAPATSEDLEAGDMIGVAIATSDIVNITSYGTVTTSL